MNATLVTLEQIIQKCYMVELGHHNTTVESMWVHGSDSWRFWVRCSDCGRCETVYLHGGDLAQRQTKLRTSAGVFLEALQEALTDAFTGPDALKEMLELICDFVELGNWDDALDGATREVLYWVHVTRLQGDWRFFGRTGP